MQTDTARRLVLHLAGPLRLCRSDGSDVTPGSPKAQAVLALLATSPSLKRSRAWVQDKLWSSSSPTRGASNLRQCVHRMRREVEVEGEWLLSDNQYLGLEPELVCVCTTIDAEGLGPTTEAPEFCEGLDVADPEFEDWIRDRRLAFEDCWEEAAQKAEAEAARVRSGELLVRPDRADERTILLIAPPHSAQDDLRNLEAILCTDIASNVAHLGGVEIRQQAVPLAAAELENAISLQIRSFRFGETISLQSVLSDPATGAVLWSDVRHLASLGSRNFAEDYAETVAHVTSATTIQLADGATTGPKTRMAYRAICNFLAFDSSKFGHCEDVLASLQDKPTSSAASLEAWRAYLRVSQIIERTTDDPKRAAEEAIAFSRHALEMDIRNPVVVSLSSAVALNVENKPQKAWALAKSAVEKGPSSPLTHAFWSWALASTGNHEAAEEASRRALALSVYQPNRSLWYISQCFAKLESGHFGEARHYADLACQASPTFRPSLRCLIALNRHLGDQLGTDRAIRKLKQIEPDFSVDFLKNDDYPTDTLRRTILSAISR